MKYNFDALKSTAYTERSDFALLGTRNAAIFGISVAATFVFIAFPQPAVQALGFMLAALLLVGLVGLALFLFGIWVTDGSRKQRAIEQFVAENNLLPCLPNYKSLPSSVQSIYATGDEVANAFYFPIGDKQVTVYEYKLRIDPPGNRAEYNVLYRIASFTLNKNYPHIFLDGMVNGLSYKFESSQRVGLEGDFDKHFSLYVPDNPNDHTAALTIISPDVMATLIDTAAPFDVEVEGRTVSLITSAPIYTAERLPKVLKATAMLIKELDHLDVSWQPMESTADLRTRGLSLKTFKRLQWAVLVTFSIAFALLFYFFRNK